MPNVDPAWLHASLDCANDGVVIETRERVIYANAAYANLLGYRRAAELIQRDMKELIADADVDRLLRFGRLRADGKQAPAAYDFDALHKEGSAVRLNASVSLATLAATAYITTIVRPLPACAGPLAGPHEQLSAREREVMELLLAGKRLKLIALELGMHENTVATHRTRLLAKVGVADTRGLYQYAVHHRLLRW